MRRRSRSMSMTLTMASSPTWTTWSGTSTWRSESSEMCTRPSMPSSTRTNAPNGTSLVTLPGTIWPIAWVRAKCRHGSSCVALSDSDTRSRSMSTSSTSTVTSSPTWTTSDGWSMCFQDSSETCTRPSTPPRSTNAPKLTIEETTPLRMAPFVQLVEELAAHLGLGLLQPGAAGKHHVVAVLVQLDDLGLDLLADVRLQIADAAHLDQRCGQEAAQADVEDQAALDDLDDGALDGLVLFLELFDRAPGALVLRALLGQDQPAFLVLLGEDQGLDLIADGHNLIGVDVVLDRELAGRDDTFGLVADVEQNLVTVNLDDGPFDDVAIVEIFDGLVDGGEEVLARADVVDGYLRRGDGGTWHVVGLLRTGLVVGTDVVGVTRDLAHRYLSRLLDSVDAGQTRSPQLVFRNQCGDCAGCGRKVRVAASTTPTLGKLRSTSGRRLVCVKESVECVVGRGAPRGYRHQVLREHDDGIVA